MVEVPKKTLDAIQATTSSLGDKIADVYAGIRNLGNYVDAHIVIIGSAMRDESLGRALQNKMQLLSRELRDRTFDGYGPLSNFAAKIDIAYALVLCRKTRSII